MRLQITNTSAITLDVHCFSFGSAGAPGFNNEYSGFGNRFFSVASRQSLEALLNQPLNTKWQHININRWLNNLTIHFVISPDYIAILDTPALQSHAGSSLPRLMLMSGYLLTVITGLCCHNQFASEGCWCGSMTGRRQLIMDDNYGLFFWHILDDCNQIWLKQIFPKSFFAIYHAVFKGV